jgi:acetyl esterase/lipase
MTHFTSPRWVFALVSGALLGALLPQDGQATEAVPSRQASEVEEYANLLYYHDPDTDVRWHQLDLYVPKGVKDFPVVVFVHGGFWMMGDKDFFGWGPEIGRCFARLGIGAVMMSYRLAPQVNYRGEAEDVARAIAWTHRHIREYGGDPQQLYACGHSAGGHLVSLVATDPTYLMALGLKISVLRGVISVSGVYRVPELDLNLNSRDARPAVARVGLRLNLFAPVFGDDAKQRLAASPLSHVRAALPPFLLIYAQRELPTLGPMAEEFATALAQHGCEVQLLRVPNRDHESVMFDARSAHDPVTKAIQRFVRVHEEVSAERDAKASGH